MGVWPDCGGQCLELVVTGLTNLTDRSVDTAVLVACCGDVLFKLIMTHLEGQLHD